MPDVSWPSFAPLLLYCCRFSLFEYLWPAFSCTLGLGAFQVLILLVPRELAHNCMLLLIMNSAASLVFCLLRNWMFQSS